TSSPLMTLISRRVPLNTFGLPGAASDIVMYVAQPAEAIDTIITRKLVVTVWAVFIRSWKFSQLPAPSAQRSRSAAARQRRPLERVVGRQFAHLRVADPLATRARAAAAHVS